MMNCEVHCSDFEQAQRPNSWADIAQTTLEHIFLFLGSDTRSL